MSPDVLVFYPTPRVDLFVHPWKEPSCLTRLEHLGRKRRSQEARRASNQKSGLGLLVNWYLHALTSSVKFVGCMLSAALNDGSLKINIVKCVVRNIKGIKSCENENMACHSWLPPFPTHINPTGQCCRWFLGQVSQSWCWKQAFATLLTGIKHQLWFHLGSRLNVLSSLLCWC